MFSHLKLFHSEKKRKEKEKEEEEASFVYGMVIAANLQNCVILNLANTYS